MIFSLRLQDGVPDWVTHVVELTKGLDGVARIAYVGEKSAWTPSSSVPDLPGLGIAQTQRQLLIDAKELVRIEQLNVMGRRPVLIGLDWTIREGDRWLLRGPNGLSQAPY